MKNSMLFLRRILDYFLLLKTDEKEKEYLKAKELSSKARKISELDEASKLFSKLGNYKDSDNEYRALKRR